MPAGVKSGDTLLAQVGAAATGSVTLTAPAGWSLSGSSSSSNGNRIQAVYLRVAGSAEPSSYTWTSNSAVSAVGGIAAYYNVNTTKRIDVSTSVFHSASSTSVMIPSVTTTQNNDQLIVFMTTFAGENPGQWTMPTGVSTEWVAEDAALGISAGFVDTPVPAAGATGSAAATVPASGTNAVAVIGLRSN